MLNAREVRMNHKAIKTLLAGILIGCILSGCQTVDQGFQTKELNGVAVTLKDNTFPKELVGFWRDVENWGWAIEFDENGRIVEVIHPLAGYVSIKPGEVTEYPMKGGGLSRYVPDTWKVKYDPQTRYLNTEIIIDDFFAEMDDDTLAGKGSDLIYGPFTEDLKVWKAEWVALRELIAITKDNPEGTPMPIDPDDTWVYITFVKVDPDKDITHRHID
jgi:hypothetical protein